MSCNYNYISKICLHFAEVLSKPPLTSPSGCSRSIYTCYWGNGCALVFVEGVVVNWPIFDLRFAGVIVEVSQRMLHPVLIIARRIFFMGVGALLIWKNSERMFCRKKTYGEGAHHPFELTTTLFSFFGSVHCSRCTSQQIATFQSLHKISVPNQ